MLKKTDIWVYSPGNLKGIRLLTGAANSGETGVLDLKNIIPENWVDVRHNMASLREYYPEHSNLGFNVSISHFMELINLEEFPKQNKNVFFVLDHLSDLSKLTLLKKHTQYKFFLEVHSPSEIQTVEVYCGEHGIPLTGYVAVTAESGGYTSKTPTFLFLQQIKNLDCLPIYLKGGIGMHTAALTKLTKIKGFVLDDQVLLFPSSPISKSTKELLSKLEGREFEVLESENESQYNIINQPWATYAKDCLIDFKNSSLAKGFEERTVLNLSRIKKSFYWGNPKSTIWPIGQMIALSVHYQKKHTTLNGFIEALHESMAKSIENVNVTTALKSGSPLAIEHKTTYPIVQGPMTRVSDSPEFASNIYDSGALPFIALALLKGDELNDLLLNTSSKMKGKSWGVGILGFVPFELRQEQIKQIVAVKPPFAIIAGGRPDQATSLEKEGIKTYLHVPVPSLLKTFIKEGATRFIFEGRECGGHVGPFNSFPLWEQMISTIISEIPKEKSNKYSILFAGGIHDAYSAAAVSLLASALTARGMKIGVLMGTAYLSCEEIVKAGAITETFQNAIIESSKTTLLHSGPGHANRCIVSPFSKEFKSKRKNLLSKGKAQEEITLSLDKLLLGRLKIASKGVKRESEGIYKKTSIPYVEKEGMFMAGEAASLLSRRQTLQELHTEVSVNSNKIILGLIKNKTMKKETKESPTDIAIVGVSLMVPGSNKTEEFWETILSKKKHLKEIPSDRWDWKLLYDEDPTAEDKISSKWGGFIDDVEFDPLKYGIPPKSIPNITTCQLLALESVDMALEDAGMDKDTMDGENTSVVFATSDSGGYLANSLVVRSCAPFFSSDTKDIKDRTQSWTEETFPGILGNVVPGRIANRMNFSGRNYAVDAACASSLLALDLGVRELTTGRSNIVVVGGIDVGQTPFGYMAFSKTGALSPTGKSRPFDKKANGIVISEGGAVTILKRLSDAKKDGDRIYAVIKGISGSSDGRGMGLTAPRSEGQQLSLHRAYSEAGFLPDSISLYEGHGTGTVVGDSEELNTILTTLKQYGAEPKSIALGSIKSIIGHTKMAAGLVSLAKTALALHYKVLPPQGNITEPLEQILQSDSPVFFHDKPMPWLRSEKNPRRAGVSAFGFGGTNFHAVLEEDKGYECSLINGGDKWPAEVLVFSADSRELLLKEIYGIKEQFSSPLAINLRDLSWSLVHKNASKKVSHRLSIVVKNMEEVLSMLDKAITFLKSNSSQTPPRITFGVKENDTTGKVAFLFSGQGSQHLQMGREMSLYFPEFRKNLEATNTELSSKYGQRFSNYIFPPLSFEENGTKQQEEKLNDTHIAQPAIGLISTAFFDLFTRLGIYADYFAGHSFGEITALHVAGVINRRDFIRLAEFRGSVMAKAGNNSGTMAVVIASKQDVEAFIQDSDLDLVIANHNGPNQVVVSGPIVSIDKAIELLKAKDIKCIELSISAAFHSPMMNDARKPLNDFIDTLEFNSPKKPIFSNSTGKLFPTEPNDIRKLIKKHLLQPVEFVSQVEEMQKSNTTIFVELGPGRILTNLVGRILNEKEHLALSVDGSESGVSTFISTIAKLWTQGLAINLEKLFDNRNVKTIPLHKLAVDYAIAPPKPTSWMINGHGAKPVNPALIKTLPQPILTSNQNNPKEKEIMNDNTPKNGSFIQRNTEQKPKNTPSPVPSTYDPTMVAYHAYQETMRQFLRTQEQIMKMFLGGANIPGSAMPEQYNAVPSTPIKAPLFSPPPSIDNRSTQVPAPEYNQTIHSTTVDPITKPSQDTVVEQSVKPEKSLNSAEEIRNALIALISDKTGYPEDMIVDELDLEADLGVDSIKRVEIFQKFSALLPEKLTAKLVSNADRFVRVKQFKLLVDTLASELMGEETTMEKQRQNAI